ncbi:virulence factor TspB C-terminal domain-related protein [Vibrio vulnificus]|uniref:virulence factor TspB C-terminal domain-related protein n=1 Tax=Vibrio vulnificus TaxID=672 RepID=UPI0031342D50
MRILIALFLFFGVSFSAFSTMYTVTGKAERSHYCGPFWSFEVGDTFSSDFNLKSCVGSYVDGREVLDVYIQNASIMIKRKTSKSWDVGTAYFLNFASSCPSGQTFNPETNRCENEPPQCLDDEIYNPETELCEPKWCSSSEAIEIMSQQEQECSAQNGILINLKCDDLSKSITSQCDLTHKDKCVIGMPAWPDCLGDNYDPIDPTNPLNPPTDFNPDTTPPNPDPEAPSNTDLNAFRHDMNTNLNHINNSLINLSDINKAIGEQINEQMKQDAAIHENDKALALKIGGDTINAINSQTASLLEGDKAIGAAIGQLGDDLGTALGDIADGTNTIPGGSCSNGFVCNGNSYECFIARQQFEQYCLLNTTMPAEDIHQRYTDMSGTMNALGQELADYQVDHGDYTKLIDSEIPIEDALKNINESNGLNFSEGCPAPYTTNVLNARFTINYQPFCDLALYIRAMLMLMASVGSMLMIAKFS